MSTPNNSSRGARDDAPRGERGDYDKRGGQGRGDSRDRRDDRPRGGYRDDRGPRGRDDRGGFRGDRDDRGGRDFRGGRDGQRGEGRSFGGDRDGRRSFSGGRDDRGGRDFRGGRDDRDRGGFRGDRDSRDRGGFRGDRDSRGGRDFRGGRDGQRDDRRSFGDRDNRGGRDSRGPGGGRDFRDGGDRRSFSGGRDDRGGRDFRGGRDDRDRGGFRSDRGPGGGRDDRDRGGFRGDRDNRRSFDNRGGRDGQRDDRRSFGDRDNRGSGGRFQDRDNRGGRDSRDGGDRRSFPGGRDERGGRDFRDRDNRGPGARSYDRGGRGPGGGRDDRDRGGFRGDRDSRGGRDFRGGRDGQRGEGRSFGGGRDDRRSFGDRDNRGGRDSRGSGGGRDFRDREDRDGRPGGDRSGAKRVTSENQLSKAARERLSALRADYDPKDEDHADEARDTYTDVENGIRLQKALAAAGVASRRASEEMIAAGRVSVDGQVVRRFGARVDPESSEIRVDGMRVVTAPDKLYFALNKPRGVVSTMWDPEGRPTLADYTGQTEERIFHVGRLDTETEGLILLTNDGELANRLTHPRYKVVKTYIAKVPGPVPHRVVREVQKGVELEDGPVEVDSFRVVDNEPPKALVEIRLHEGRKHIVRRLMEAVGHPVADLARTQVGPIDLNALKLGTMRALTSREVSELYEAAGL
ncbi:pseudouridine synthase [Nocardiopsis dassonvillei]|uniref:pseudouridine synthase n=1 Tax=Nocardiopsis dassonvillei TaxID=2014 RepID=UPI0033EB6E76